ncbi:uncharacterized protein MONOS_18649 [Monocercomonoides exilis]|uniref:uncharacterized protein n=1 Tax=Monocercomonoides exilis TaxID=2049356 RepID=UPI003559FAFA|nr:hypothetical protein MONOS_18649 [Monocercomonoides exilis]
MSNQLVSKEETTEYLEKNVMPALLPALEALLKEAEKPIDPESPLNPLHWLASYLLRNNVKRKK